MNELESWNKAAWDCLIRHAGTGDWFTSDDIIEQVGVPDTSGTPNAGNNRIGQMIRKAAEQGLIYHDGRVTKSRRKSRHKGAIRLWRGTDKMLTGVDFP